MVLGDVYDVILRYLDAWLITLVKLDGRLGSQNDNFSEGILLAATWSVFSFGQFSPKLKGGGREAVVIKLIRAGGID